MRGLETNKRRPQWRNYIDYWLPPKNWIPIWEFVDVPGGSAYCDDEPILNDSDRRKISNWCAKNSTAPWTYRVTSFGLQIGFHSDEDAMLFKLKFV